MLLAAVLGGCAAPHTYAEVQATAQAAGCWPDPYPTPRLVTVTPAGTALTSTGTVLPGTPTATALPTTTPYPRCPAAPGATLIPWPTPVPNPPPYPTMEPRRWVSGSDRLMTMHLPGSVYALDLAVHPTEGWPVVGVTQRSWGMPIQAFVRIYDPRTQDWGAARQVDVGMASNGTDRFGSIAVAVSGDRTVYAAWGASDRAQDSAGDTTATPDIWVSASLDYGSTWSPPRSIAQGCWTVQDMAADTDGNLVVLASCYAGDSSRATLVVKPAGDDWQPAERLPVTGSSGSAVIAGEGSDARIIALTTGFKESERGRLNLLSRPVTGDTWQIRSLAFDLPPDSALDDPRSGAAWHIRSLMFPSTNSAGALSAGIAFTWATSDRSMLFALLSLDGGQSWSPIEPILVRRGSPDRVGHLDFVAPAYDPVAGRLVTFWTCCGAAQWRPEASSHYASWSQPGSAVWQAWPNVLALGAIQAHDTATAQATGSRMVWLGWIEASQQVTVRSVDLNAIIPAEDYPTTTPQPSATAAGGA